MRRSLIVLTAFALPCVLQLCLAQSEQLDILSGPVTIISPPDAFDVSGTHISLTRSASLCNRSNDSSGAVVEACNQRNTFTTADLFLGERVELSGYDHAGKHAFRASEVVILPPPGSIGGTAILDLIPSRQPSNSAEHFVRADGYLLRITPDTKLKFEAPLKSFADLSTNQWIQYSGTPSDDGTVLLKYARILPNTISDSENKLLYKTDYDPSAVPDDAHQNVWKEAFIGIDPKKIPPYRDPAMQARVERIGQSLIPAYQRALPDSDLTKIVFRFQLVEGARWHDAFTTPAGVVLVPHQLVERMQNDDQLATVLADNIAEALEKDALRIRPVATEAFAGVAAEYATIALPVVGLATGLGALGLQGREQHLISAQLAQSGRVSLCLLHDAGYNIEQAPLAWWLLAGKKDKPLDQIKLPPRAETLYDSLGFAWRNPAMNAASQTAASATSAQSAGFPSHP